MSGPECPRTPDTEVPRVLLSQFSHPQEEDPDIDVRVLVPVVAVEAVLKEEARDEPVAIHVESVARRVQVLEWHPLTRALEVREDEGEQERDAPERRAVVSRPRVVLPILLAELFHLGDGLAQRTIGKTGNPEHKRVLGGLVVLELPTLEVAELAVGVLVSRRVLLQCVARLDLPGDGAGVADVARVLTPQSNDLPDTLLALVLLALDEQLDRIVIGEGHHVGVCHVVGEELARELLEQLRLLDDRRQLLVAKIGQRVHDGNE